MCLADVYHCEVRPVSESLDEFVELLQRFHERGSGAAAEVDDQGPVRVDEVAQLDRGLALQVGQGHVGEGGA